MTWRIISISFPGAGGFRLGSWPKIKRITSICCNGIWVGKLAEDRAHHQHQLGMTQRDCKHGDRPKSASTASTCTQAFVYSLTATRGMMEYIKQSK